MFDTNENAESGNCLIARRREIAMARNPDWIPTKQDAFVDWSQRLVNAVEGVYLALGITGAVFTAFKARQTSFMAAWIALQRQEKTHSITVQRNTLTGTHKKYLRDWYNQYIRYNPALTDDIRARLGVPIRNTTYTPFVVGDHRVGFELLPDAPFVVLLKCWDLASGEKRILCGMSGIMVRFAVSDKPITTIAELTESFLISTAIHRLSLPDTQRGQWLSVSCSWLSGTGKRGADSPIEATIIP
jgi:hypothetical protein